MSEITVLEANENGANSLANINGNLAALNAGKQERVFYTVGASNADYITEGIADNVQIQAAIDAASAAGGGIVFIKGGIYNIANSAAPAGASSPNVGLILPSNISLIGAGRKTTILTTGAIPVGAGENYFTMFCNENVTTGGNTGIFISHLGVQMPAPLLNATAMARYNSGTEFRGVSNSAFFDCWFNNCGIMFSALLNYYLTTNVFTLGNNKNNIISFCHFEGVTGSIAFNGAQECWFRDNRVDGAYDDAFLIGGSGTGIHILDNQIDSTSPVTNIGSSTASIYVVNDGGVAASDTWMNSIILRGNTIKNNFTLNKGARDGIKLGGPQHNVKILDNTITNCGYGIEIRDSAIFNDIVVEGNTVYLNNADGILVQANLSSSVVAGVKVCNNFAFDNGVGSTSSGLSLGGTNGGTLDIEVKSNRFYDSTGSTQIYSISIGTDTAANAAVVHAFNNELLQRERVSHFW